MNYFLTAAALKAASFNRFTMALYNTLASRRQSAVPVWREQGEWILSSLPAHPCRLLDLGTGWAHAYTLYAVLFRDNDEIHCFDVRDSRRFQSFLATVGAVAAQIDDMPVSTAVKERARDRARALQAAACFEDAYAIAGIQYQGRDDGMPDYPDAWFDGIFSIDVLEHVEAGLFPAAARRWAELLKPDGVFLAQVGIDDHLAHYTGVLQPKRYMRYSETVWRHLLGNSVQYINRLTASQIVQLLRDAGLTIDDVETHDLNTIWPDDVHPDYLWQSIDDIQACRLFVRGHRPLEPDQQQPTARAAEMVRR